ncbi:MAG: DNA polymerase III subunit delta [Oscillospiraceae bacterium]|nr:DNA polymerase III subunit delta [Oscillospiraceae bacterium]
MAKKTKNERPFVYKAVVNELYEAGPKALYLLYGPEDYLREDYLGKLKALCIPEGEDSFSYKRFNGPGVDLRELAEAMDTPPFLTERSFIEIRDEDLNQLSDAKSFLSLLETIPDYCTVALVQGTQFTPDGRLKTVGAIRRLAVEIKFTQSPEDVLIKWIARRFAAFGKRIEMEAAQHLIFVSGNLMNRLIPEIDKIAAYAKGEAVTVADVDAVAHHLPEAQVYEMADHLSRHEYNVAMQVLYELLSDKNNKPVAILAMLGSQMRRLYAARLAIDEGLGADYLSELYGNTGSFAFRQLNSARGFSLEQLKRAVEICAETDLQLKSSSADDAALLEEAVLRIAAGETDAEN